MTAVVYRTRAFHTLHFYGWEWTRGRVTRAGWVRHEPWTAAQALAWLGRALLSPRRARFPSAVMVRDGAFRFDLGSQLAVTADSRRLTLRVWP